MKQKLITVGKYVAIGTVVVGGCVCLYKGTKKLVEKIKNKKSNKKGRK